MSQDEEEATKYTIKNNNYHNNNGHTKCYEYQYQHNQQVMPLYENFTINNNTSNNKNNHVSPTTTDHFEVERVQNKSETFNDEYHFVSETTELKLEARDKDFQTLKTDTDEYENIQFPSEKPIDKKILLQKYFRSALVGPRNNIYENLCRGCNYGVFNARGPLCTFCECIVNGVNSIKSDDSVTVEEESLITSNNIYENICGYCGLIYSGNADTECKCQLNEINNKKSLKSKESEELLITKEEKVKEGKKKVKLSKSKSFSKSTKPKLFSNFWDTLRKPRNNTLNTKKPLEIVHHVEGFEHVFHTKDTFDLQRICELKRIGTSNSDQHIYGRLKQNDLQTSQEEFNSTQSLTQISSSQTRVQAKKIRISKAKFLRSQSTQPPKQSEIITSHNPSKESPTLYLNESVCQWMRTLRHEVISYNITCDEYTDTLCYPKSIPSKNVLISYKAPMVVVTNNLNNLQQLQDTLLNKDLLNVTEIITLRRHNSMTSWDSLEIEEATENQQKQILHQQQDCYQLMVEEFITNIKQRQMFNITAAMKKDKQIDNVKVMAGVNNNDSYHNNNNIPLRQATLTTTQNNNNRHKRQGMYLRLEDQNIHEENLQNNFNLEKRIIRNASESNITKEEEEDFEEETANNIYENLNYSPALSKECNNTSITVKTSPNNELDSNLVSRCVPQPEKGWNLIKTHKRQGIHENNVLEAFEALLRTEQDIPYKSPKHEFENKEYLEFTQNESQKDVTFSNDTSCLELQTFGDKNLSISLHFPTQIFDIVELIKHQQLSSSLNTNIICYDKYLVVFLRYISQTNKELPNKHSHHHHHLQLYKLTNKQLVRKFKKFYNYCEFKAVEAKLPQSISRALPYVSSNLKLDLKKANGYSDGDFKISNTESFGNYIKTTDFINIKNLEKVTVLKETDFEVTQQNKHKVKTPPQVPRRDPKTKLSPTSENKPILSSPTNLARNLKTKLSSTKENKVIRSPPTDHSRKIIKMTKPSCNLVNETNTKTLQNEEESIYQPIWKFKTKGEVTERYHTDDDYYDIKELKEIIKQQDMNSGELPKILISDDPYMEEEEDHNNWEPDEEFVFTKQLKKHRSSSLTSDPNSTIRSNHSANSSIGTASSLSGSTITEFASSTATLASSVSTSLMHHLFRNIGIFYSLTEPKLRAIIYDYDRVHASSYFAKNLINSQINDSGLGKSFTPLPRKLTYTSSPCNSLTSSPASLSRRHHLSKSSASLISSESDNVSVTSAKSKVLTTPSNAASAAVSINPQLISNSVQAWKLQLLNVNYMEDEEDMVVSESEILRAQKIKEDLGPPPPIKLQPHLKHSFISRSTDNILGLPLEDDKKTIGERLANMMRFSPIQRGILNINGRNSPKSTKKDYLKNRARQTTSLYLEDGLAPKYPIFGAPLEQLELKNNVPRFVVDTVDYIERKDRIVQDGLYRASGNKVLIDELKQNISKSHIYDSNLIAADDIHTITSLLKQFFRDLTTPLIPQEIYNRITANLADKQGIDAIRIAIEEIKEPNKSTLRFLLKHLTNVAVCSSSNRMNASNLAIVWGPSLFAQNDTYDMIGRMNTLTKVLIENYDRIFATNERLL